MATDYLGNAAVFSWAIMSLFAWLLPHISMEIGEYHRAVRKSPVWSVDPSTKALGMSAVKRAAVGANVLFILLVVGAALAVSLLTRDLDSRMVSIVTGLSRLMGAAVLFALSWHFPEWLEVYHIRKKPTLPVTMSLRALKFNVFCGVSWQYTEVYFLLLPFYCGQGVAPIPVSVIAGLVIGAVVDACVYWGRTRVRGGKRKVARRVVYGMISAVLVFSAALFAEGCLYINDVWEAHHDGVVIWLGAFFAWLVVGSLTHFILWKRTKDIVDEKYNARRSLAFAKSTKYKNAIGQKLVEDVPKTLEGHLENAKSAAKNAASAFGSSPNPQELESNSNEKDEETAKGRSKVAFSISLPTQYDAFADTPQDNDADQIQDVTEEEFSDEAGGSQKSLMYDVDVADDPTYCSLIKSKLCGGDGERSCCVSCCTDKDTCTAKALTWTWYTMWVILSCFALYFVIINIGATHQQNVVRERLPSVKVLLYEDMNDIEVCAYDGDGTEGSLNETSVITTFPSKEAAHDAGFLILHCGACAACSTWPNIKYEYTTRKFLAAESARCARKSLTGGVDAVHQCLMAHPINWDDACGRCWTVDVLCAKKHCAFNFLQSTMINSMTDFAVGIEHVTAASCEEANCEAFPYPANFVECSGATRRRMNVTSSIARPKDEECANVDVSWETLFPGE